MSDGTSMQCIGCGYDLTATSSEGVCPECGLDVEVSLTSPRRDTAWWNRHRRGAYFFAAGIGGYLFVQFGFRLLISAVGATTPLLLNSQIFMYIVITICNLSILYGGWALTTPFPGEAGRVRNRRLLVRASYIAAAAINVGMMMTPMWIGAAIWQRSAQWLRQPQSVTLVVVLAVVIGVALRSFLKGRKSLRTPTTARIGAVLLFLIVLALYAMYDFPIIGALWMTQFAATSFWMREVAGQLRRPRWQLAATRETWAILILVVVIYGGQQLSMIMNQNGSGTSLLAQALPTINIVGIIGCLAAIIALPVGIIMLHRSVDR